MVGMRIFFFSFWLCFDCCCARVGERRNRIHGWFFASVRTPGQFPRTVYQHIKLPGTESCSSMPKKQNCQYWTSLWTSSGNLRVWGSDYKLSSMYLEILHRRWLQKAKLAEVLNSHVNDCSNALSTFMQTFYQQTWKHLTEEIIALFV